jgi:hypothetical protein
MYSQLSSLEISVKFVGVFSENARSFVDSLHVRVRKVAKIHQS